MKILYFSASILPSHYANSVNVMKMSSALSSQNDITLVGILGKKEVKFDDIYNYYNVKPSFNLDLLPYKSGLRARLIKLLRLLPSCDIIYTRYVLAAFIGVFVFHKKTIFEYHGVSDNVLNRFAERLLSCSNNVIHVFITHSLQKEYFKIFPRLQKRASIVLPDGADAPEEYIPIYRKRLTCGYIGSFQKGKGVELVIELARLLPDTIFHIVGGDDFQIKELSSQSPSNIQWHGFLNQKEAMRVLKNEIDIALLPNSRNVYVGKKGNANIGSYTSPMKLFEYMAYGKAIVASDLSVLKEIITNGDNALLASPENLNEWENAIKCLQNDRNLYASISGKAYEDFMRNYTWHSRCMKLNEYLKG